MSYFDRAVADGHAKLTGEGKQQAVPAPNGGQRDFSLSASTGERAGVRCRGLQLAERKKPYAVIECKADGVTDPSLTKRSSRRAATAP